jgi:hypothetical protein
LRETGYPDPSAADRVNSAGAVAPRSAIR